MSALENSLFSCGILHPLQHLLNKHKDINIWTVQMIALNAFANNTGQILKFKAAVRRKHKLINDRDESICAQRFSSPESDSEDAKEKRSVLDSAYQLPEVLTRVEAALQNCGLLEPIFEILRVSAEFNLWDAILISLEQVARQSDQLWAFEDAIELQWKQIKHDVTMNSENADAYFEGSLNPIDEDMQFQDDLNSTAENPFIIQDLGESLSQMSKVEKCLQDCGVLENIQRCVDNGEVISCFDVGLISSEVIAYNFGMHKDFQEAIKRRAQANKPNSKRRRRESTELTTEGYTS